MLPFLTNTSPWFSFIGHPRNRVDLDRIGGTSLLRRYSVNEGDFLSKIGLLPPLVIGLINFSGQAITGEVIAVMCMPEQMVLPSARQYVLEAVRLAISRGTRVIGLGALTAPATGAGASITDHVPPGVTVTTGNAYTAAVAFHNVVEACRYLGASSPRIAILGCTGSVGFAATHLVARTGWPLTLIGRTEERVRHLFPDLKGTAQACSTLQGVYDADVVLVLTNDPTAKLDADFLKPGSIVIDIAQPANVSRERYPAFWTRGIEVCEGGLVEIAGYNCTFDFSLPHGFTFACLAETYLFARDGLTEHSVGRASPALAVYLERLAARYGCSPKVLALQGPNLLHSKSGCDGLDPDRPTDL